MIWLQFLFLPRHSLRSSARILSSHGFALSGLAAVLGLTVKGLFTLTHFLSLDCNPRTQAWGSGASGSTNTPAWHSPTIMPQVFGKYLNQKKSLEPSIDERRKKGTDKRKSKWRPLSPVFHEAMLTSILWPAHLPFIAAILNTITD